MDKIKDIKEKYAKTDQELMEVDESLAEIRKKKEEAEDNKRSAKMRGDKTKATEEKHRMELIITQGVKKQELLKTKLVKFNIERKVNEKKLAKLIPQGASSPSGAGRFTLKAKPQPQPQPQPQPVATGSGKHRRQKAVSRLKPIQEDEEEIRTVIKPAKNNLSYIDLNNDPYLINKIR